MNTDARVVMRVATLAFTLLLSEGSLFASQDVVTKPAHLQQLVCVRSLRQRVKAEITQTLTTIGVPSDSQAVLKFYALVPPNIETQTCNGCTISFPSNPELSAIQSKTVVDIRNPGMRFVVAEVPISMLKNSRDGTLASPIPVRVVYDMSLYSTELVRPGNGGTPTFLTSDERKLALEETPELDFKAPAFQRYLKDLGLLGKLPGESKTEFALRSYRAIALDIYRKAKALGPPPKENPFKASLLCEAHNDGCGTCSILFAAAMRANGIPARLLVGRWAISLDPRSADKSNKDQYHVRGDIETEAGVFPIDETFSYIQYKLWKDENRADANMDMDFGRNAGDFLAMHVNEINVPGALPSEQKPDGVLRIPFFQGILLTYFGKDFTNFRQSWDESQSSWRIRKGSD